MFALAFVIITVTANASTDWLTGTWEAELHGEAKTFTIVLHFTFDGRKVSGTVEFPEHDLEFPITEGTVHGNEVRFKGAGLWRGTLEGKDLRLTRELDGGKKQEMIARRTAP